MLKHLLSVTAIVCLASAAQAEGDPKKGKRVFKKCTACHTLKDGKHKAGPSLYKIIGAPSASTEGFSYSAAMLEAGLTWDAATLTTFLEGPKELVPGTKMNFRGLKKPQDIANLIAYIEDESQ